MVADHRSPHILHPLVLCPLGPVHLVNSMQRSACSLLRHLQDYRTVVQRESPTKLQYSFAAGACGRRSCQVDVRLLVKLYSTVFIIFHPHHSLDLGQSHFSSQLAPSEALVAVCLTTQSAALPWDGLTDGQRNVHTMRAHSLDMPGIILGRFLSTKTRWVIARSFCSLSIQCQASRRVNTSHMTHPKE